MLKPKSNYRDLSNRVQSVMKTRQDNNMTNCTSVIYVEDETKLLCLIGLGVIYDKNQTRQRRDQSIGIIFTETKIELSGLI